MDLRPVATCSCVKCQILMKEAPTGSDWFTPPGIRVDRSVAATLWHDRKAPERPPSYDDKL